MRKLKLFFACLLMAFLSIGQVWAAEQVAYTLTPAAGSNNSYTGNCDVAISGITWNVTGNASLVPWRLGGSKTNCAGVDRNVFSKTEMGDAIIKIELTVGAASSVTVNSLKLIVASDADFNTQIDEVTGTFAANSTITFQPTSPATEWATGAYYKFVFNLTVTASSGNKFVAFSEAKFYKEVATETCVTPTFSPVAGTFYGSQEITLSTTTTGASIYYTLDGTTPSSSNGTLYDDPFTITETKTVKAIAVKDGATDSGVAEATYTAGATVSSYVIDFETNNLAAYVNWVFDKLAIRTSTITAHGGTYYGGNANNSTTTSGTTSATITTAEKIATPGALTFYISKESTNSTASSWKAQVSEDGDTWTDVQSFAAQSMTKGDWDECTADLSAHTDVYVRISYGSSGAIRAIDDITLSTTPSLLKPTIEGAENFVNTTTVTLSHATADAIYYTTNGDAPTTSSTEYSAPFELNATATVKAIAVKGSDESPVAEKVFTKIVPWTVAEANEQLGISTPQNGKYVRGIISQIDSYSSNAITYWISDDGSTTGQLEVYKGKNLNNTNFSAISDLALGDVVVVYGNLKVFEPSSGGSINEFDAGNYLISKEAPAVEAPVFSPDGGGFMGETDVTITCGTASSTIYYTTDGTTPTKSSSEYTAAIHLNATTTITAIAYVDEEHSIVVAKTFTLTAPMTVAEALTALDTEDPINNVAVIGVISTAPSSNPSSGRLTYYISDDGSATDELEVYLGYGLNGASFSNKTDLQVGDEVTVFGNLTIHNSTTKEFAAGSRLLAFNRPAVAVTGIDLTESTAEVTVGSTVTLHASVTPGNATDQAIVWSVTSGDDKASVDENGVVTGIEEGTAVIRAASHEDESIYEECTVTVNAAPAPLTDYYEKVTSGDVAEGTYLIVYETGSLAFNGGLETLDASSNTIAVTITNDHKIGVTTETEAATFYIDPTAGSIQAANGKYIGQGSNANGMAVSDNALVNTLSIDGDGNAVVVSAGGAYLRYNSTSGQERFRYFKSSSYTSQKAIQLYKLANEVIKPASGLAWDPAADIEITVGDAFSAPALLNPNNIDAADITIESSNTDLATVTNGVVELVADATGSATITATYTGETYKPTTVSYKIKVNAAHSIYVDKLNVNFGSVVKDAIVADKTITVTLTAVDAATATLAGDGASAFSIDPAVLTASGSITISASSATVGIYAATITISDDAGNAESKVVNLSFSVTEPAAEETPVSTTSKWVPATEIADGMQVLITGVKADVTYAMGAASSNGNNRTSVAGSLDEGVFTPGENTMPFTLVATGAVNTYYIKTSNNQYLYNASTSGNSYLRTKAEQENVSWTITLDGDGNAVITSVENTNRTLMRLNPNGQNNPLFNCYASGQNAIKLYVPQTPEPPTPTYTTVRPSLSAGRYYTICYPKAMTEIKGGTLWSFVGRDADFAYIQQESAPFAAGKPYLIYATAEKLEAVLEGEDAAAAGNYNGLYGTLSYMSNADLTGVGADYLLKNNELHPIGTGAYLDAQRAYIIKNDIPEGAPAHAPGKNIRSMPMHKDATTGIDDLNASDAPRKMVIDGTMFILRGEKLYDATGRMVK